MSHINTIQRDHIFEIVLNRPERRNALQIQTLQQIAEAVDAAEQTQGVRVIFVRGEGPCFSAGLDLMAMGGFQDVLGENWMQQGYKLTRLWQENISRLQQSFLPTVALLHSYCLGGGLEIALACDLRIGADTTTLSLEEARLGLIPDGGGTTRLTQLVGPARAKELILTGKRIDATTAETWGLLNKVVPEASLIETGDELASEIALCAPRAVSAAKRIINGLENPSGGLQMEMVEQFPLFHSKDLGEGIQAKLERRAPRWGNE